MQDKVQLIKQSLAAQFPSSKVRSLGDAIRLNTESLIDSDVVFLGVLSVQRTVDIKVKRSGTGLAVIVTV